MIILWNFNDQKNDNFHANLEKDFELFTIWLHLMSLGVNIEVLYIFCTLIFMALIQRKKKYHSSFWIDDNQISLFWNYLVYRELRKEFPKERLEYRYFRGKKMKKNTWRYSIMKFHDLHHFACPADDFLPNHKNKYVINHKVSATNISIIVETNFWVKFFGGAIFELGIFC